MSMIRSLSSVIFVSAIVGCCSCSQPQKTIFSPGAVQSTLPAGQTLAAGQLLQHYYELKDALVTTNSKDAAVAAAAMKATLKELYGNPADTAGLLHSAIVTTAADTLQQQLDYILAATDKSCEQQRVCFKPLSGAIYTFIKGIGMHRVMAFHHYCPMAMNEQGAYWLSASPEIENPYFGAKMLTCGELIDTIK